MWRGVSGQVAQPTESQDVGEKIGKTFPLAFSALRMGLNGQK